MCDVAKGFCKTNFVAKITIENGQQHFCNTSSVANISATHPLWQIFLQHILCGKYFCNIICVAKIIQKKNKRFEVIATSILLQRGYRNITLVAKGLCCPSDCYSRLHLTVSKASIFFRYQRWPLSAGQRVASPV
jgi:hypothetical protein